MRNKKSILYVLCSLIIVLPLHAFTQEEAERFPDHLNTQGRFSFYWGYNRAVFSPTNIHVHGEDYDFTVYDVKAKDRPSPVSLVYVKPTSIWIPQYVFRMGYNLTDRISISGGLDHMKYVVTQGQAVTMSGVISSIASDAYAGSYLNEVITLEPALLTFEHTDGFNLMSIEMEYTLPITDVWRNRLRFSWSAGLGGIWMVTKTNIRVLGKGLDNDFHIAGYTGVVKTGPRIDLWDRFFFLFETKAGYASLHSVLIHNDSPEIGDHDVRFLEYYGAFGVYFRLWQPRS